MFLSLSLSLSLSVSVSLFPSHSLSLKSTNISLGEGKKNQFDCILMHYIYVLLEQFSQILFLDPRVRWDGEGSTY